MSIHKGMHFSYTMKCCRFGSLLSKKTRISLFHIVNIMTVDAMVMQGTYHFSLAVSLQIINNMQFLWKLKYFHAAILVTQGCILAYQECILCLFWNSKLLMKYYRQWIIYILRELGMGSAPKHFSYSTSEKRWLKGTSGNAYIVYWWLSARLL